MQLKSVFSLSLAKLSTLLRSIFSDKVSQLTQILIYQVCQNNMKTEAVFAKTKMNNKWKVNFLQNSSLSIQYIYSFEVFIETYLELFFDLVWSF